MAWHVMSYKLAFNFLFLFSISNAAYPLFFLLPIAGINGGFCLFLSNVTNLFTTYANVK